MTPRPEGHADFRPSTSAASLRRPTRRQSIGYAFHGIGLMLRTEPNARLHAAATVLACVLALLLGISRLEWCVLVAAIVAVWTAEALNTALEYLSDVASPDFHPLIEQAKDVAAGAVLVTAAGAAVLGGLIFGPRLWQWLA